ncbi:MAG TPA: hypothetical protein DDY74_07340 [Pseudothermotoga sp.]|nr:hypothetical protein [Pseudothermotoga sp.]
MRICDNCGKELRTPIEVCNPFTEIGERSKYEFCSTDCLWQYFAPSNVIQLITCMWSYKFKIDPPGP